MEGPLTGVRILDLTAHVAGPSATQLLGDMGAEVIKIEPPTGDPIRRGVAAPIHNGDNFMYLAFNRNKKGICLDLRTPAGKEAFYELVKVSDVVCDNSRPGVVERLGADYETLRKINPRIICFSSSGYGSTGPYAERPGYDMIAQAETGIASITGFPDQGPTKCGPAIVDLCTGIFGALAVACALNGRARTGQGQRVETSLMNVGTYLMTYHLVHYMMSGEVPPRLGNGHLGTAPQGFYETKDGGHVALGPCWPRIARAVGEEWLLEDPRFKDAQKRSENRDVLDDILKRAFLGMNLADWLEILRSEDIASAPVNTVDRVANHPQVQHQQMLIQLAHQLGGEVGVVNNPIRLQGGHSPNHYTPAPRLGEDTEMVLKQILGYSEEQLRELRRQEEENATETQRHTIKEK